MNTKGVVTLLTCIMLITITFSLLVPVASEDGTTPPEVVGPEPSTRAMDATISINASDVLRTLPEDLYGTNIQFVHTGDGIYDESSDSFKPGIVEKTKQLGVKTMRFPGGALADTYHWRDGVGPQTSRPLVNNYFSGELESAAYGTDEHMRFCEQINATATITADFGNGTPLEAANWVEYCNVEMPTNGTSGWAVDMYDGNESAPAGYFAWLRGQFGHPQPYNIEKWEVGNEVYNDWTNTYNATEYAERFILFADAMRAVDANITIAAVGYEKAEDGWNGETESWNRQVARVAGHKIDAFNIHTYTPGYDGNSIIMVGNMDIGMDTWFPVTGYYNIQFLAQGFSHLGTYPPDDGIYSNLQVGLDGVPRANVTIDSMFPGFYNASIWITAGIHNLTMAFTNDIYDPVLGRDRNVIFYKEVLAVYTGGQISINYTNSSLVYDAAMAGPVEIGRQVKMLNKLLVEETGRDDIEVWVTELNTLYGLYGFKVDQALEFKSAVAVTDIMLQHVQAGATIIQPWSLVDNWLLGVLTDAQIQGERSPYHAIELLTKGTRTDLLNTTVTSPQFDLEEDFGFMEAVPNVDYVNAIATSDDDGMSIMMLNKHKDEAMNVTLDVEGMEFEPEAKMTLLHSAAPDTYDINPAGDEYNFTTGKVGEGIHLNTSMPFKYNSWGNFDGRHGSMEFWFQPDWDGDDNVPHAIMSAGVRFIIGTDAAGSLAALVFNNNFTQMVVAGGDISAWNAGEWHHIAVTWENGGNLTMYLDGVMAQSSAFTFNFSYVWQDTGLTFGTMWINRSQSMDGYIDELRISDSVRSDAQILTSFNAGNSGTPLAVEADTTMLLPFDGDLNDLERDERTHMTTTTIMLNQTGGIIELYACSVALLELDRNWSYYQPDLVITEHGVVEQELLFGENVSVWANVSNAGRWILDGEVGMSFVIDGVVYNETMNMTGPFAIGEWYLFELDVGLNGSYGNLTITFDAFTDVMELNVTNNHAASWVNVSYYLNLTALTTPGLSGPMTTEDGNITLMWNKTMDGILFIEQGNLTNWTLIYNQTEGEENVTEGNLSLALTEEGVYRYRAWLELDHYMPSNYSAVVEVNFTRPLVVPPPPVPELGIPILTLDTNLTSEGEVWVLWTAVSNATGYELMVQMKYGGFSEVLYIGSNTSYLYTFDSSDVFIFWVRSYNDTHIGNWSLNISQEYTIPFKQLATITSHSFNPSIVDTNDVVTFKIVVDPGDAIISSVEVSICQGTICGLPLDMTDDGNNTYTMNVGPFDIAGERSFKVTVRTDLGSVQGDYYINVTQAPPWPGDPDPLDDGDDDEDWTPLGIAFGFAALLLVLLIIGVLVLLGIYTNKKKQKEAEECAADEPCDDEEEDEEELHIQVKMAKSEHIDPTMEHEEADIERVAGVKERKMPTSVPVVRDIKDIPEEELEEVPEEQDPETWALPETEEGLDDVLGSTEKAEVMEEEAEALEEEAVDDPDAMEVPAGEESSEEVADELLTEEDLEEGSEDVAEDVPEEETTAEEDLADDDLDELDDLDFDDMDLDE